MDYENITKVDTCNFIYQQRVLKSLHDQFSVFFIPETSLLYSGLELINEKQQLKTRTLAITDEHQLSVSLGQVVLVTLYLTQSLGLSLKYPMVYNAHRSTIIFHVNKETRNLPLYLGVSRYDYKSIDLAINLLGRNLRNILSALERIKDRQGYGKVTQAPPSLNESQMSKTKGGDDANQEPVFTNTILLFLYRICEFQVY